MSRSKTGFVINSLDNELTAIVRYMATTVLPPTGMEDQMIYLSEERTFYTYKNAEWKPFLPIRKEFLDEATQGEIDSNISRIYGENGQFVGSVSDVHIATDGHLQVTADSSNNYLTFGLTTVTKDKLSDSLVTQIDNLVQGITVGSVTTNRTIELRPADASELTITANADSDVIQFGINKVSRAKLAQDVVNDIESAVQSISTGSTSAAASNIQFTSNSNEFRIIANEEADTVNFEIWNVPKSKLATEVQTSLDSAVRTITANSEYVDGPNITFTSTDGTVLIDPMLSTDSIDFKVRNVTADEMDNFTKDIVDNAVHTVRVVDGSDVQMMRGHTLTFTHDDEFNVVPDVGQTSLHFSLNRLPRGKLEQSILDDLDGSVKSVRVNNGTPIGGEMLLFNSSSEISASADPSSNTITLGITMIPKSKIHSDVTNKVDTAMQTFTLMNGQTINGPNIRLNSGAGVTFAIDPSTNTLSINGPNKVYINSSVPSPSAHQNGDLVMDTSVTPPRWWFLAGGNWVEVLPTWVNRTQSNVQVSNFGGQLDASRIGNWSQSNWSETNINSRSFVNNKPSWIKSSQIDVSLNTFKGDLDWDRISAKPTSFVAHQLKISTEFFPSDPVIGSVTFRSDLGKSYVYDGSQWTTIESVVSTQITTITGPLPTTGVVNGQVVFKTDNGLTYVATLDACGNASWTSVGGAFQWLRDNQSEVSLNGFTGNLLWSRIDPSTIPVHFTTDKIRTGTNLPEENVSVKGEVFYRTDINAMYTFNGTNWIRQNEFIDWMRTIQSEVQLGGFSGNLDYSRVANAPSLAAYTPTAGIVGLVIAGQSQLPVVDFSGDFPWNRVSGKPDWVVSSQGSIPMSLFQGNLDHTRIDNVPVPNWTQTDPAQRNYIINKPAWINSTQGNISVDGFSGDLPYSRISGAPSWLNGTQSNVLLSNFGGSIPYSSVSSRPLNLSHLVNDTNFLRITQVLVDSTLTVTRDTSANTVTLAVLDVPWNKLSNVPTHFTSDRIMNGTTLPSTGMDEGDVFYKTDTKEMYVHSGLTWVKMAVHVDWVSPTQVGVSVSSFGGNFPSSRVDGRIVDASSAPASNLHDGLIWKNSTNGSFSIYYNGTWYITGTSWLTASQSGVNLSGFNNNSGFVDPSGARAAVTSGLVVSDLSGNFPYSRLSSVPANVTELATTSNFLRTANVFGSSGVTVTRDSSASTVTLDVSAVPWSKVTNAPATYMTERVKVYSSLGDFPGTPPTGTLVYVSGNLFFYNGTSWIRLDEYVSWVNPTQSSVTMSSFGGQLPASRVSGNLVTGSSAPSSPHDGMLWWDTSGNAMYAWSPNTWLKIGSSWSTAAQSSVLLSQFNNNSGFVDASGARAAVTSGLVVSGLSGDFPYTRISGRPVQLTDLSNNTDFLQIAKLSVDSTLQMTVIDASKTVSLRAGTIPWSNLSSVPSTFNAYQMRSGTSFPGSPSAGDVLYRTDLSKLYIYSSATSAWLAVNNEIAWLNATQSSVQANAFGGTFPDSRVSDKIVVSTTEPSGTYVGMVWTNPSTKITKFYTTVTTAANVTTKSLTLGGGQYTTGSNLTLHGTSFSVSFWAKRNSTSNCHVFNQRKSAGGNENFELKFTSVSLILNTGSVSCTASIPADTTNWHHYVAVHNITNAAKIVYYDGTLMGNQVNSSALNVSGVTTFTIGADYGGNNKFNGFLDEFAIYSKVLSLEEVQSIYNNGVPPVLKNLATAPNLEAYYPFETDINDNSGKSGRNLTINTGSAAFSSNAISSPYTLNVNQWVTLNAPWMAVDSQGSVDLSSFSNANAQYINSTQAVSAVKSGVLVTDLSGNIPYSSITSRPTALSNLTDDTRLLDPSAITTSDSVVNLTRGTKTLQVNLNQIPWSKIDASSIPAYFNTDHVQHGATRPTGGLDAGDVFFDTSENFFYVHNGSIWKKVAYSPNWISDTQSNISLSGWGGNLPFDRIVNKFVASSAQPVQVAFTNGKSLSFSGSQYGVATSALSYISNYTWSLWTKTTSTFQHVLFSYQNGSGHTRELYMTASGFIRIATAQGTDVNTTKIVNDGTWHHIVITESSTNYASLYVDGTLFGGAQLSSLSSTGITSVYIGQNYWGSWRYQGILDEIAVFNTCITPTQVVEIYNTGSPTNFMMHSAMANLQAWWSFEDTYMSGSNALDVTSNGRNLALTGSPTSSTDIKPGSATSYTMSTGMLWYNTTNDTLYVYNGTQWTSVVPSWAVKKTQVEVNVGSFDNTTAGYINNTQALAIVRANVQLNELQSNLSYSRLSGAPTNVSSFTNNSNYLDPSAIDVSGTQLTIYRGTNSVKIELQDIPWTRVSGKPTHFSTDRVKTGTTLPQDGGNFGEGYLFFHTGEDMLYYHNGTNWAKVGNDIAWLNATQSNVGISSFGGNLPFPRVSGYFVEQTTAPNPAYAGMIWRNTTDSNLYIYNGASFVILRTTWSTASQSGVNVSGFTNDASYTSVSAVQGMISALRLSDISGSVVYSQLSGRPTQLSDLSNNTVVEISRLAVGDTLQKDVSGTNVTLQVSRVPWSKIDTKPTTTSGAGFLADRVISGTVVPSSGVAGDLFYDINDKQLSVHNGDASNAWIKLGTKLDWTSPTQNLVNLSSFGGQLSGNRVDDKLRVSSTEPSSGLHTGLIWRDSSNNVIRVWDGTTWQLLATSWAQTLQGNVNIGGFANNVQYVTDATLKSNVLSKVAITDLSGSLVYSSLTGKPGSLADFTNTPGFIQYDNILNQDGNTSLTITRNNEARTVKLAVNTSGLTIPWSQITSAPTYVSQGVFDKRYGVGSFSQRPTSNVSAGDLFYSLGDVSNVPMLFVHDGNSWVQQSAPDTAIFALKTEILTTEDFLPYTRLRKGTVAPTIDVSIGDMFYDTSRNVLSIHNGTIWLDRIPDYTDFVTNGNVDVKVANAMTASLPNLLGATYPNRADVSANYVSIGHFNSTLGGYATSTNLTTNYPTRSDLTTALSPYLTTANAITTYLSIANFNTAMSTRDSSNVKTTELLALLVGYQDNMDINAFAGQLDYSRLVNLPSWLEFDSFDVDIGLLGGTIAYSRITGAPQLSDVQSDWNQTNSVLTSFIQNKPSWITPLQSTIDVSLFGGKLDFMRLGSVPSWIRSSQGSIDIGGFTGSLDFNSLANRPTWIRPMQQSLVSLSGFKADIRLSRVNNMYVAPDSTQVGEMIVNLDDRELYFYNGLIWKKASAVVQGASGENGARMDVVASLAAAVGKVTGDMVFDQGAKIAYYHDGTSFVKVGDIKRVSSTQADPNLVGTVIYNTSDNFLYYHNNTAWVKLQTTGVVTTKLPLVVPSSPTSGDVYFDGSSIRVYSNNNQWVSSQSNSNGAIPSWVKTTSAEVNLSIFNNDLPKSVRVVSTVSGLPGVSGDFVFDASSSSLFVYRNSQWVMAGSSATIPSWVETDASLVNLSSFNNDLSQNALPSWINSDPKTINLSAFTNDLSSTTVDGSFVVMPMPIYFHGNGFSLAGIKGTCSFDPSLEENLFTSYKIILVNPARNKGVVLKTIQVGEPKLAVIERPGAYLDVPFYIYGDVVNPLITSVVGSDVTFDGFSLYCLTSKSAVLPTNYIPFSNRLLLSNSTPANSALDLSGITIDTYGKIMSAAPKLTMDGLVVNNAVIRYYERPELIGFEKVIALSQNGGTWAVGTVIENDDGEVLNIPYIVVGDYSIWCIAYRTPTGLYPASLDYQNRITFIPNTFDSKLFTSSAYISQQESLGLKTGLIMDPSSITHHNTNGTMITFSGIRSYENTPYYSSTVSGFKRALKHDSIDGRMVGSMRFDASLNAYVNDEAYHMYPAVFSGFYDSIVTDYTDAYVFELKNDPNAPWLPQDPSTLIRLFGHGRTDMIFRLFQMTYAFIKYGFSTTTDTYMQNELYTWYLDNIVGYETSLLQSGQMFVSNDTNAISFHPSIFNRTNTVIPTVSMDTLYVSLGN